MYAKNGGISLGVVPSRVGVRAPRLPPAIRRFLHQILFIAPLFWFMELAQNQLYLWATGNYGWGYRPGPDGLPTAWYSLMSAPLWAMTIATFSLLDAIFERSRTPYLLRTVIAGVVGFAGEFTAGFVGDRYLHHCLQIWPKSNLVYISLTALPFWCADYLIFHLLTRELRSAHAYRASIG
jgi:hypothetical protein